MLPNAEPRLVVQPIEIGGFPYPPGVALFVNAYLLHHDPAIYPEPYAFRPERFLEREGGQAPGTYTWIPFGGGRRRCLGASFALLEMKLVLRAVLERCELRPAGERGGGRPQAQHHDQPGPRVRSRAEGARGYACSVHTRGGATVSVRTSSPGRRGCSSHHAKLQPLGISRT